MIGTPAWRVFVVSVATVVSAFLAVVLVLWASPLVSSIKSNNPRILEDVVTVVVDEDVDREGLDKVEVVEAVVFVVVGIVDEGSCPFVVSCSSSTVVAFVVDDVVEIVELELELEVLLIVKVDVDVELVSPFESAPPSEPFRCLPRNITFQSRPKTLPDGTHTEVMNKGYKGTPSLTVRRHVHPCVRDMWRVNR